MRSPVLAVSLVAVAAAAVSAVSIPSRPDSRTAIVNSVAAPDEALYPVPRGFASEVLPIASRDTTGLQKRDSHTHHKKQQSKAVKHVANNKPKKRTSTRDVVKDPKARNTRVSQHLSESDKSQRDRQRAVRKHDKLPPAQAESSYGNSYAGIQKGQSMTGPSNSEPAGTVIDIGTLKSCCLPRIHQLKVQMVSGNLQDGRASRSDNAIGGSAGGINPVEDAISAPAQDAHGSTIITVGPNVIHISHSELDFPIDWNIRFSYDLPYRSQLYF